MEVKENKGEGKNPPNQEIYKLSKEELERKKDKLRAESKVRMRDKKFMTISDVDPEDARWFKKFCDENVQGKQFLGIKVIRTIMERLDPLVKNILTQIDDLNTRVKLLEQPGEDTERKIEIPPTQGRGTH